MKKSVMRFLSMHDLLRTEAAGKAVSREYVEVCRMIDTYQSELLKVRLSPLCCF